MRTAIDHHNYTHEDLFQVFTESSFLEKIKLHYNGKPIDAIKAIEKQATELIKDIHISEKGIRSKQNLKAMCL